MNFTECIDYLNNLSEQIFFDELKDDSYFQFNIIGKDNGEFYIHIKNNRMKVFVGEYRERDVLYIVTLAGLEKILNNVIDPIYAYTTNKIKIHGDTSLGRSFLSLLSKK